MDFDQLTAFISMLKDPAQFEAKIQSLQAKEDSIKSLIETKTKLDQVDAFVAMMEEAATRHAKESSDAIAGAQAQAANILQTAQKALEDAETTKVVANDKANQNRAKQKELSAKEADLATKEKDLNEREAGIVQREIEVGEARQEVMAKLEKLRSAMA